MATAALPELVMLPLSPWSLKARWAVVASSVPVRITKAAIGSLIQPWVFALRTRRWRVTYPMLLLPGGSVLADSFDIALWADAAGTSPGSLFPPGHEATIKHWNASSEVLICYARGALSRALLTSADTRRKFMPAPLRALGALGDWLTLAVCKSFAAKYQAATAAAPLEKCEGVLREVQAALLKGGGVNGYILGGATLSYADICIVVALQAVSPLPAPYNTAAPRIGQQGAPGLAGREEFADLLEWRAQMLAKHFPTDALKAQLKS